MSPVSQIRLVRTDAEPFAGETLEEVYGETETGRVIVGVERDETFRTDATTPIEDGDAAVVAGTDEAIQAFERERAHS